MMKGNMAMMIPQTLIMSWINAFFAGFVICGLAFFFELWWMFWILGGRIIRDPGWLLTINSEVAIPAYHTLQVNVAVRSRDEGSRCPMGVESVVVLPELVRVAVGFHIPAGGR